RHRRLRFSFPDISLEGAECHHAETVQAHVAIVPLADMPCQDAFAVATGRRLGESARTGDTAVTRVEPVTQDAPLWNLCHFSSSDRRLGKSSRDYGSLSARASRAP